MIDILFAYNKIYREAISPKYNPYIRLLIRAT